MTLLAVGAVVEKFLFRPVLKKSLREESTMLLAAGLAFFFDGLILLLFGQKQRGVPKIVDGIQNWAILPLSLLTIKLSWGFALYL